jgi:hypothetical protein
MNVLGQSIIVIDKYEAAVELLEKRSGLYSSRFVFVMPYSFYKSAKANTSSRPISPVLELLPGWGSEGLILIPYGNATPTIIMVISWLILPSFLGERWYVCQRNVRMTT